MYPFKILQKYSFYVQYKDGNNTLISRLITYCMRLTQYLNHQHINSPDFILYKSANLDKENLLVAWICILYFWLAQMFFVFFHIARICILYFCIARICILYCKNLYFVIFYCMNLHFLFVYLCHVFCFSFKAYKWPRMKPFYSYVIENFKTTLKSSSL